MPRSYAGKGREAGLGPLSGIKVVEFAGIGPGPMCAMLLADLGADVVRIERQGGELGVPKSAAHDVLRRNRQCLTLDLKTEAGHLTARKLVDRADALIEGSRPGVMERLGLGPEACLASNPRLVYGRMTGWGQDGPLAHAAGHDLNYIAITGALHATGRQGQPPTPPLNLVGDFGGGALYLAFGLACALLETQRSGIGQVVDAAMTEGASSMMAVFHGLHAAGRWELNRGSNILDSGAFFYDCYECSDGKWVSVAAIEPKFCALLIDALEIDPRALPPQHDKTRWPEGRAILAARFAEKTRAEWCALLEGSDACFAPVLSLAEAPDHPHMRAREAFVEVDGITQPAPAPRFSRTSPAAPQPASTLDDASTVLARWECASNSESAPRHSFE